MFKYNKFGKLQLVMWQVSVKNDETKINYTEVFLIFQLTYSFLLHFKDYLSHHCVSKLLGGGV